MLVEGTDLHIDSTPTNQWGRQSDLKLRESVGDRIHGETEGHFRGINDGSRTRIDHGIGEVWRNRELSEAVEEIA